MKINRDLTVDDIDSGSTVVDDLARPEALAPTEVKHGDARAVS